MFALNCLLQVEQVSSESDDHDDPLALALRSLRFFILRRFSLLHTRSVPKVRGKVSKCLKQILPIYE